MNDWLSGARQWWSTRSLKKKADAVYRANVFSVPLG